MENIKDHENTVKMVPKWCPEGSQGSPRLQKSMNNTKDRLKPIYSETLLPFLWKNGAQGGPGVPQREPQNEEKAIENDVSFGQRSESDLFLILGVFGTSEDGKSMLFLSKSIHS